MSRAERPTVSVVVPIFNEAATIERLIDELSSVLPGCCREYEILIIDDGSSDGSAELLDKAAARDPHLHVVHFRTNFGQTAALSAGFHRARFEVVVTLDADLQNDPADIPALLDKIAQGNDIVSGWRHQRQDPFWTRRVPSYVANRLISRITGVRLHDYGCTLKAYRRELLQHIQLYGELHRFIPALGAWAGAAVAEVPVRHHPRRHGRSNYGLSRVFKVLLDLLTVKFLLDYATRPIHVFGAIGFASGLMGVLTLGATVLLRFLPPPGERLDMSGNPLLYISLLAILFAGLFVAIGLLAELLVRTYHETQRKPIYVIRGPAAARTDEPDGADDFSARG
ncbi:MAG TPA: glycosyltransferase family 2 protein [Acidobacteriota bacterium]